MNQIYALEGMTCQGCVASVTKALNAVEGVSSAIVSLEEKKVNINSSKMISLETLESNLPQKFTISTYAEVVSSNVDSRDKSKLAQLKPLFLILSYIGVASILLHRHNMDVNSIMTDFMGLFFIVFSFFKMLDIKGFAQSFRMYDPIAAIVPSYASLYPFIETILGIMLLMRFNVDIALIATIVILGFTTYGVTKVLMSKRTIKCACLGTALNLPMTEATFIENALMIVMAMVMLVF